MIGAGNRAEKYDQKPWDGKCCRRCSECHHQTDPIRWSSHEDPYVVDITSCRGCGTGFIIWSQPIFDKDENYIGVKFKQAKI